MDTSSFFSNPTSLVQKQYEALRAICHDKKPTYEVAEKFGYTVSSLYSLVRDFKNYLKEERPYKHFFIEPQLGRKQRNDYQDISNTIIDLRKKYMSVSDIKAVLDAQNKIISEKHIYNILKKDGFARLPKRRQKERNMPQKVAAITAPKPSLLISNCEEFNTQNAGVLCFLPYIKKYGIDKIIEASGYYGTKLLPKLNSILAFIALKLVNVRRYSSDDLWCMDRGLGLFAGLNVLPKASWFTSYSHRITREMNLTFLRELHKLWRDNNLLSDTANLDFVAVPYFGEDDHLENNWSGTRGKALSSILAVIAHDPDTGIMTYGDTNVRHDNESGVVLEFLDFYKQAGSKLNYLVFDSKFTIYENLRKLDNSNVKFITIRRRGKNIVNAIEATHSKAWKDVRVETSNNKTRLVKVLDQNVLLKGYGKEIRQIAVTGHGKIKPTLIITNDFDMGTKDIIRKYTRRWLIEKNISEQTHFFHLNRVSSSMVIKVDFDLTMTILAHNLYRLLAVDLHGYSHNTAQSLYDKFIHNSGIASIDNSVITVKMRKKRNLPAILSIMSRYLPEKIHWLNNKNLKIEATTFS